MSSFGCHNTTYRATPARTLIIRHTRRMIHDTPILIPLSAASQHAAAHGSISCYLSLSVRASCQYLTVRLCSSGPTLLGRLSSGGSTWHMYVDIFFCDNRVDGVHTATVYLVLIITS